MIPIVEKPPTSKTDFAEGIEKVHDEVDGMVYLDSAEGEESADDYHGSTEVGQNRNEYPLTIAAATRFGVGKKGLCEIGNALLSDMGNFIIYICVFG